MKSAKYKDISVVGRIAYGMMCVEEYLLHKYPEHNWNLLVDKLWEITGLNLWDEWMDEVIEIIPEYLFEFPDYNSSEFEYLSEEKYLELKCMYKDTGEDINQLLKLYYELANAHAYTSIKGVGNESLIKLDEIIEFLVKNNVKLPLDSEIMKHGFDERNGWETPLMDDFFLKYLTNIV